MSAVMATLLLPSIATWSVMFLANSPNMAARSSLPLSHVSTSLTAWLMTTFGMPSLLRGRQEGHGWDADPLGDGEYGLAVERRQEASCGSPKIREKCPDKGLSSQAVSSRTSPNPGGCVTQAHIG